MALNFNGIRMPKVNVDTGRLGNFLHKAMQNLKARNEITSQPSEWDYIDPASGDVDYDAYEADVTQFNKQQASIPNTPPPSATPTPAPVSAPKAGPSVQEAVMGQFGGDMSKYNAWWNSLPEGQRPKNWQSALKLLQAGQTSLLQEAMSPVVPEGVGGMPAGAGGALDRAQARAQAPSMKARLQQGLDSIGNMPYQPVSAEQEALAQAQREEETIKRATFDMMGF